MNGQTAMQGGIGQMAPRQPLTGPMDVAGGGLANITYDDLARQGRFGDKFVTHVGEGEMVLPVEFLNQNPYIKNKIHTEIAEMGLNPSDFTMSSGDLSNMNPQTGLPEFGFFSKIWKAVKKVVKKVAPIVLPIVATVACGGNPACGAAASGLYTKSQGGSWGDALKSAAFTYAGQSFAQGAGANLGQGGPGGWAGVQETLSPYNFTTGKWQTPGIFSPAQTFGNQAGGIQGFFQGAGGAARGALSPDMTMAQGWSGGQTGGTWLGGTSNVTGKQGIWDSMRGNVTPGAGPAPKPPNAFEKSARAMDKTTKDITKEMAANKGNVQPNPNIGGGTVGGGGVTPPGGTVGGGTGGGAGEGIFGTGVTLGQAVTAGASLAPLIGTALAEEQPIPIDDLGEIDQQQRDDILAYNACLGSGDGNLTPNCADEFAQATDLHSGSWGVNFMSSLGDYYTAPVQQVPVQQVVQQARGGAINGPGTGTSDDIPAYLSDGEFVMTAKAVRNAGGGSRKKGVANMYKMMRALESNSGCPSCAAA